MAIMLLWSVESLYCKVISQHGIINSLLNVVMYSLIQNCTSYAWILLSLSAHSLCYVIFVSRVIISQFLQRPNTAIIKHNIRLIRPVIILGKFSPLGHIYFFNCILWLCSWYQGTISILISLRVKGTNCFFIQTQILSIVWLATHRRQSGDNIIVDRN